MPRFSSLRLLAVGCVIALGGCASTGIKLSPAPDHPHAVDGHWVVDLSRSEDPDASPGAGGGHGGGMGGGHGHGGGGMGGGGMGGGGMGGGRHGGSGATASGTDTRPGAGAGTGDSMRRALLLPNTLDLAIQHGNLLLTADGQLRTLPMVSGRDNLDITRAGWDADTLVVVIHTDDKRGDIVQRYDIAPDRSRLTVTTEFKRKSKTSSVVREFTPAPVAKPAA